MPTELSVASEQLTYFAKFRRPVLDLWAEGRRIVGGIYSAFEPFGVSLADIRAEGFNPADQVISVSLGVYGVYKFRFDRIETAIFNVTDEVYAKLPALCSASLSWIRKADPSVSVGLHQFVHSTHCRLAGEKRVELLSRLVPNAPASGGLNKGPGVIYHWDVPELGWNTQLLIDASLPVSDGLFLMFTVNIASDSIDLQETAVAGRKYLLQVLSDLNLTVKEWAD